MGVLVHPEGMGISVFDLERFTLSRICYWHNRWSDIEKTKKKEADKLANKDKNGF